jgi:hypothetical protein
MRAIPEADGFRVHQPQIRFVDEGRGLKTVAGPLTGRTPLRDLVELLVDVRNQAVERRRVAMPPSQEQCRDVTRMASNLGILPALGRRGLDKIAPLARAILRTQPCSLRAREQWHPRWFGPKCVQGVYPGARRGAWKISFPHDHYLITSSR